MGHKKAIILIAIAFTSFSASATVYKWVDENGQVHYSDKPQRDAATVEFDPGKTSTITLVAPKVGQDSTGDSTVPDYQVQLVSPESGATVRDNSGNMNLSVTLDPGLQPGHQLQLLVDGQVVRTTGTQGAFTLENLNRGEHNLKAQVVDKSGKVLASSEQRQVFLHRHSRLMPQGTPTPAPSNGSE